MNLYEAIKKNSDNLDLSIEISPVQSNDVWLKFLVNYVHGVLVDGSAKVFIEGSDFGIPEYPQISKLSYNGGDECNYDRGWDVEPENKEVFNYICKSLVDYRDRHPYSLDEAEGRPSIPMDVKELVENIIYDDRNLDLRTAQFEGSNFVVEPRTNLDEALFDKIVQRISDQFNTYGISYDSIEDVDNNVVVYDCYMSDEAYKEYKDNSDDYKQEDEDFYMLNKDTDEKVHVYKDGNRWYDSDGNRYMGYLSKEDVKAYFKGNWEELNESEDNSTEVIKNVIKSKNLPNGTKVSSITDDTFNSIVKDVQSKMPNSDEKEVRNKVAGTLFSMFEESDDIEIRDSSKKAYKTIYNNYSEPIRFQIRNSNGGLLGGSPTLDGAKKIASEKIAEYKDDPWNKDMKIFIERLKESDEEKVKVSLYGDVKEYPTVEDAIKDMKTAMSMCDPNSSEFKRYLDIYYQLKDGKTDCTDNFNESDDFYVIPGNLQSIIDSYSTDVNDPMYDNGYKVPDELLELSLRPPENMRIRDWMRIEAPMEYQLNKIPENLTFKAIHEDPSLFKDLAYEIDSDPRDVIYNQLKDMYGEDFVSNIYEAEKSTVDGRAEFVRKPVNLDDIKTWGVGSDYFKVVAIKELSDEEYDDFTSSLISKDYGWIKKLGKKCRCADGCFYCIEVINKDNSSSPHILVEPEGYSYARYAAIKPTDMKEADEYEIEGMGTISEERLRKEYDKDVADGDPRSYEDWKYDKLNDERGAIKKVDATEKYWDATTLKQDAFLRVMKFNFVEPHGCQYIITNDANELERFRADSDEDAIDYYNEFKSGIDSGLIEIMPADLNIKSIVPREDFNETELSDRKFCDLPDDFQKKVINYLLKKKRGTTDEIIKYLMHAKIGDFNDTSLLTQDEFVDLYEV